MEPLIRNRVAESAIEVFNLDDVWGGTPVVTIDISEFLDGGFILREKSFRESVKAHDWSFTEGAHVGVYCSTDAIVPPWAFMLVASKVRDVAESVQIGSELDVRRTVFSRLLAAMDWSRYDDRIVVVKGCGSKTVPESAYAEATTHLQNVARKIMYGEPCSSVPIWRRPSS